MVSEAHTSGSEGSEVNPDVLKLVEYLWEEASGQLESVLSVPVATIKADQVDKAEAALLTIKRLIQEGTSENLSKKHLVCNFKLDWTVKLHLRLPCLISNHVLVSESHVRFRIMC